MVTLTNNSGRDRGVPVAHGRTVIVARGASVEISDSDADAIEKNPTAAHWLASGLIDISEPAITEQEPEQENDDDRKDELIAELAEFGIKKTKRSSVESLEQALNDALNADPEPEADNTSDNLSDPETEDDAAGH